MVQKTSLRKSESLGNNGEGEGIQVLTRGLLFSLHDIWGFKMKRGET